MKFPADRGYNDLVEFLQKSFSKKDDDVDFMLHFTSSSLDTKMVILDERTWISFRNQSDHRIRISLSRLGADVSGKDGGPSGSGGQGQGEGTLSVDSDVLDGSRAAWGHVDSVDSSTQGRRERSTSDEAARRLSLIHLDASSTNVSGSADSRTRTRTSSHNDDGKQSGSKDSRRAECSNDWQLATVDLGRLMNAVVISVNGVRLEELDVEFQASILRNQQRPLFLAVDVPAPTMNDTIVEGAPSPVGAATPAAAVASGGSSVEVTGAMPPAEASDGASAEDVGAPGATTAVKDDEDIPGGNSMRQNSSADSVDRLDRLDKVQKEQKEQKENQYHSIRFSVFKSKFEHPSAAKMCRKVGNMCRCIK